MKIVQVCRLYKPHIGGVETHVAEVSRQLVADGHQVTVLTSQDNQQEPLTETIDGVRVIRLPQKKADKKLPTWKWIWSQRQLLSDGDIIQIHDVAWWLVPVWPLIEDKTYITFHGWETTYPVRWQAKLQRWLFSFLSRGQIHVGKWIQEFYWDKPTFITYGGVRPVKKITSINQSKKKDQKNINITFIGRLSQDNDIAAYIELAKLLKTAGFSLKIQWMGDGPERPACEKVGKVSGYTSEVEPLSAAADLVWASSYLSILQAQNMGKVVCSFYSNQLKRRYLETYPASDLLLLSDSSVVMADKIQALFAQGQQLKRLQDQARIYAQAQSWQAVTNIYYRLWGT